MVAFINKMQAEGWYEHTKKIVPFAPIQAGKQTIVEIPMETPQRWDTNLFYITTENTNGGYVFLIDSDGALSECKPVQVNAPFHLYTPKSGIKGGKQFTLRLMSDGISDKSLIVVYGFGKAK